MGRYGKRSGWIGGVQALVQCAEEATWQHCNALVVGAFSWEEEVKERQVVNVMLCACLLMPSR